MEWHTDLELGYAPMDDIHEEFVDIVARLQAAPDDRLAELLAELHLHLASHFGQENAWMEETAFPPRDCHIGEHDAVLKSVKDVRLLLADQGNTRICRELVAALADWFPGHAAHLDSALAHWLCKRRLGGSPVVLRRGQDRCNRGQA
ncbi:hemerythrin domain-containing protein [Bordetella avium]|nr:hemerythrin domain-containing protein [Bordetella avium]AZY48157.1 hemerythrin [Bordetella avium]RIQ14608.1 hemerythrin [Bordetella avium]RIQ16719.1 hemerythrin [Bordetella avium]RIQ35053.1 hemerythrin [Bordetella avium]RIQ40955.1 hemerythrin [Bordetella avium]